MTHIFTRKTAALAAALFLASAAPVLAAESSSYRGCDGYGPDSLEGDGMTSTATFLLVFSAPNMGNTAQSATRAGQAGIDACDAAIKDVNERHWMRKVSLLRARAFHRMETGDYPATFADLDAADAAGHDEPLYDRSLALGNTLIRAYALRLSGEQAKADALAADALKARPYNRQVNLSALVAVGRSGDPEVVLTALRNLYRLAPLSGVSLLDEDFSLRRFDEVVALYPVIQTDAASSLSTPEYLRATLGYAYAQAALGHGDAAHGALDDASAFVAHRSPPNAAPRTSETDTAQSGQHASRRPEDFDRMIGAWRTLVDWRLAIAQGHATDVLTHFQHTTPVQNPTYIDLVTALAAALPPKLRATLPPLPAPAPSDRSTQRMRDFYTYLPAAEAEANIPSFAEKNWPNISGFTITPDAQDTRISFRGKVGTPSVLEELALLKAAQMARDAGKTGLVVVNRHDVHYTITTTYYSIPVRTDPNGFSTDLTVQFVDSAALPDAFQATPWRVIDVATVIDTLEPVYVPKKR